MKLIIHYILIQVQLRKNSPGGGVVPSPAFRIFPCLLCLLAMTLCGCQGRISSGSNPDAVQTTEAVSWSDCKPIGNMELSYATQFQVTFYEHEMSLIDIADGRSYLLLPEGSRIPEGLPEDIVVLSQPLSDIYLAASSAMDLFNGLNALDRISMTSTSAESWSLPEIAQAVKTGQITYVGRYSAPDYEYLLSNDCSLAIESTMIYHAPDTQRQLEAIGIPVLIERSSYETHPLGRLEWIRLYGLLLGEQDKADEFFQKQASLLEQMQQAEPTAKTVAFFYITSNGMINVRKPGDYVSKMIELAGGSYALDSKDLHVEDNALSTMNLSIEAFYSLAKDSDILIYNSTIEGELESLQELYEKNPLFADFKAVKEGTVWCARANMFQKTSGAADMIADFYAILHETGKTLTYLKHLDGAVQ